MDTDTYQNQIDEEVKKDNFIARHSELFCVTPLSKYLALVLFVILPFLGGYIGYTFAPEKVVEVEKVLEDKNTRETEKVTDENFKAEELELSKMQASEELISDTTIAGTLLFEAANFVVESYTCPDRSYQDCYRLTFTGSDETVDISSIYVEYLEKIDENPDVKLLEVTYYSTSTDRIYFRSGIPDSGACCSLDYFDVATREFSKDDRYMNSPFYIVSFLSDDGRFLATYGKDGKSLNIFDLEINKEIYKYSASQELILFKCRPEPDSHITFRSEKVASFDVFVDNGDDFGCNSFHETINVKLDT